MRPRARIPILPALLALLAVVGLLAVASWHDGAVHVDAAPAAAAAYHVHAADAHDDPDSPVHMAAHTIAQAITVPAALAAIVPLAAAAPVWVAGASGLAAGRPPPSLLRPPRR